MKRNVTILGLLMLLMVSACSRSVAPKSDEEKTLYVMGAMLFGNRLRGLDLTDREIAFVLQGAKDSLRKGDIQEQIVEFGPKVREFIQMRGEKVLAEAKKKGTEFVKKFMDDEKEKAKKTDSGLVYVVEQEGSGGKPSPTDIVKVKYKGQLVDGTVFDENAEGMELPLNRVIKGWAEALQLMSPGSKMKLVIPPDIAYGDFGAPPKIPGGSTLVFDVELMEFKKAPPSPPEKK